RMNGAPIGEVELNAAITGFFDVPVLMVSGDDCLAKEAQEIFDNIETAVVKKAIDRWTARCLSLQNAHQEIKTKAYKAVHRLRDFKAYKVIGSTEFEIEWTST